jgi:hypothetical protein
MSSGQGQGGGRHETGWYGREGVTAVVETVRNNMFAQFRQGLRAG